MKPSKVIVGTMFLFGCLLYILILRHVLFVENMNSIRTAWPYLQAEFLESEYIGRNPLINGTDDYMRRWSDSAFYKVSFRIKNLSSRASERSIEDIIRIYPHMDGVGEIIKPEVEERSLKYQSLAPEIPGKSSVDVVYYVEVEEGTETLCAYYDPSLRNGDTETIEFSLTP